MPPRFRLLVADDNLDIHGDFRTILLPPVSADTSADTLRAALFDNEDDDPSSPAAPPPRATIRTYQVDFAASGEQAVALARAALEQNDPYALAFMDVRMPPGQDGILTLRQIWELDPRVQGIVCTAYSDYSWEEIIRILGDTDRLIILKKPFDPVEVRQLAAALTAKWATARAAEASLREINTKKRQMQQIVDNTTALIYAKDLDGRYLLANRRFQDNFRLTQDQIVGKLDTEIFPPHIAATLQAGDQEVLTRASTTEATETETTLPEAGKEHIYISVKFPLRGDDGQPYAICGVHTDITPHKEAEQAKETARRAAENASNAKTRFLGNVSHELRTPLNAIIGYTEMLLEEAHDGAIEATLGDLEKDLGRVRQSAQHLLNIVNDLLSVTQLEAGQVILNPTTVHLPRLLAETADMVQSQIRQRGNILHLDPLPPGLPETCHLDPVRLQQILINLLVNAGKFTDNGLVTLTPARHGSHIHFTVRDTGIGIPPELQQYIFDPFLQAKPADYKPGGGIGLGLSICQRYATLMGGRITLESAPGQGSAFTLALPLLPPAPA